MPRPRSAFTLIELLVVIAIIAILVALLLPAVQAVREAARKSQCQDHLHNLAIAVMNYEGTLKVFPYRQGGTWQPFPNGNDNQGSGLVMLLPYIEQKPLYDQIAAPQGTIPPFGDDARDASTYALWDSDIDIFLCPSAPEAKLFNKKFGLINYGMSGGDSSTYITHRAPSSTANARRNVRGLFGYQTSRRIAEVTDGTSNTICFAEIPSSLALDRVLGGSARNQGMGAVDTPRVCLSLAGPNGKFVSSVTDTSNARGNRWARGSVPYFAVNTILPPNSPVCTFESDFQSIGQYPAGSYHPGGAHIGLLDGKVTFISENIDTGNLNTTDLKTTGNRSPYGVWGALGSIAGGEPAGKF